MIILPLQRICQTQRGKKKKGLVFFDNSDEYNFDLSNMKLVYANTFFMMLVNALAAICLNCKSVLMKQWADCSILQLYLSSWGHVKVFLAIYMPWQGKDFLHYSQYIFLSKRRRRKKNIEVPGTVDLTTSHVLLLSE